MIQILDGYCEEPNIYADDIGRYNIALHGAGDYVFPVGERLAYEMVSNNEINVKDGMFLTQGRRGIVRPGTKEKCVIENGVQGMKRHDLIVIEYRKDPSSLVESHAVRVIKGTAAKTAADPELTAGDIPAGDPVHQMPLYRVKLNGISIEAVERMFTEKKTIQSVELDEENQALYLTIGD